MPVTVAAPEAKPANTERITVTKGLAGQDDHFDQLQKYFKEMQKATVETSAPDDFVSFATCAYYFGVIMMETESDPAASEECGDEDAEGEPEEETEPVPESVYPASSAPTSPPASSIGSRFSIIDPDKEKNGGPESDEVIYDRWKLLSDQDKVLKWREAFMAKVSESDDEEEPVLPSRNRIGLASDDESDGELFYSGKGKAPEYPGSFLIPHSQDNIATPTTASTGDDPESFINWPEDMPIDNDGYRNHGGPSLNNPDTLTDLFGNQNHSGPSSFNNPDTPVDLFADIYSPIVPVTVDKQLGREYLEPERYNSPAPELPEVPADPKYQAFLYEEAVRYRDELRAKRIAEYERKKAKRVRQFAAPPLKVHPIPPLTLTAQKVKKPIGLIYLWTSQTFDDPLHVGECSMGFYIAPEYRKKEYLVDALNAVVKQAFRDQQCHRLQAIVVENNDKLYTLQLLSASGFRHEGTRRRAFFSPFAHEWKDVTYFAMLATEWVYDNNNTSSSVRLRTTSLWDEILSRHQRELDDLQRLEEKSLKRSSSIETIRQVGPVSPRAGVYFDYTSSDTQSTANTEMSGPSSVGQLSVQRKKLVLGAVAQARRQRQGSTSSASGSGLNSVPRSPASPSSPTSPSVVRARYSPAVPASPTRPRKRSIGGLSFSSASSSASSSSTASSQWDFMDDVPRS